MVDLKKENIIINMPEDPKDLKYIEDTVNAYCANAIFRQIEKLYPNNKKDQQKALNYTVEYIEKNGIKLI